MDEKLLAWLRTQSDSAPPADLEDLLPVTNMGKKENKTVMFYPSPNRTEKPSNWKTYSIWDNVVAVYNREREGILLSVNGGRLEDMETFDIESFIGFEVVLAGGDELTFWKSREGETPTAYGSSNKTSSFLKVSLKPYAGDSSFFESIEGPLLVTMYLLRRRGITISEVRLKEE